MATKTHNICVLARFRPSSETELNDSKEADEPEFISDMEVEIKRSHSSNKSKSMPPFKATLDRIFPMSTSQKKLFDCVGLPMVQAVLEGYNATLFAYGAGKTFTMFGPENKKAEKDAGLVQRCCAYLFAKLRKSTQGVSSQVTEWNVTASFIQIYKSTLSDLVNPNKKLSIKHDPQTNVPYVKNVTTISVNNVQDILLNLKVAFLNRKVASHKLNAHSSRSHMLLMIEVVQKINDGSVKRSKLNFGDLAGSENITKAGSANNAKRKQEAIEINSSLTALTSSIYFLSKGRRPSYRAHPLTHILQDSLGGNSKTTIVVAASPHIMNRSETINTLRFAMTAKTVKNKAKINNVISRAHLVRRIEELEMENANLKARNIEFQTKLGSISVGVSVDKNKNINQIEVLKNRTKNQQVRNIELEKQNIDLSKDIECMTHELTKLRGNELAFERKREIMKQRYNESQNELALLENKFNKFKEQMDKQIQRQRNNINMKQSQKKELEKIVQELNLQNTDLRTQNDSLMQQMNVLKRKTNDSDVLKVKSEMENKENKENDNKIILDCNEQNIGPAMVLVHKFAASEANDCRLTQKQRIEKTTQMMGDLSDDINSLMGKWLPKRMNKSTPSKPLVFQIRQLIGHFNVMVKQMKSTEQSYQNDLRLDIRRRDQEINTLKKQTKLVHTLKDDIIEKNDIIENLKNELRIKNEQLLVQTRTQHQIHSKYNPKAGRPLPPNPKKRHNESVERGRRSSVQLNQSTTICIEEVSDH